MVVIESPKLLLMAALADFLKQAGVNNKQKKVRNKKPNNHVFFFINFY
jgi:hypothetical protein